MWQEYSSKKHIHQERLKARKLKKTAWWQSKLQEGFCYYCEEEFTREELTMDHKTPLSRGGTSNKSNCVPCCKICNSKKQSQTPVELILGSEEE